MRFNIIFIGLEQVQRPVLKSPQRLRGLLARAEQWYDLLPTKPLREMERVVWQHGFTGHGLITREPPEPIL